jgi:hypothetical protein
VNKAQANIAALKISPDFYFPVEFMPAAPIYPSDLFLTEH